MQFDPLSQTGRNLQSDPAVNELWMETLFCNMFLFPHNQSVFFQSDITEI